MTREKMFYDVVIVGAGPAGLTTAIRIKQLAEIAEKEVSVCVIDKGAEVGSHILSGAVLEPRALNELFPDWRSRETPLQVPVSEDHFLFLTQKKAWKLPTPRPMRNHGNYIISLGAFCIWLKEQAEALGVEIYPGFAAVDVLMNETRQVFGILTGDMGVERDGNPGPNFQPGVEIHAKQTVLAEGCRGSLTQRLFETFDLRRKTQPQTYGIGIKELWEVDSGAYLAGKVVHTIGWPLDSKTYGGSFLYHLNDQKVAVGFVVGLDYQNPYLSPFEEFQRFKTHPDIKSLFQGGKRLGYGSRALNEGGFQSIPKLTFSGGLLVGDCAGFLNVPKIKGTHTAMKSGMVAAEVIFKYLCQENDAICELTDYPKHLKHSWLWSELKKVRNIRPAFKKGLWLGMTYAAIDTYLLRGHAPWTFKNHEDATCLKRANLAKKISYPKPDNEVTFDRLSSVYLANVFHEENQPCHLILKNKKVPMEVNYKLYDSPEQRYCPAGVYEIVYNVNKDPYLQINAQNCIHCKTCDIKDPLQNICWVPPQGGEGPNYSGM